MQIPFSIQGLYQVYYRPAGFFCYLKDSPRILVPAIILVLLFILTNLFTMDKSIKPEIERLRAKGVNFEILQQNGKYPYLKLKLKRLFLREFPIAFFYPLLMASFAAFWMYIIKPGYVFKQALSLILYGELLQNLGRALSGFLFLNGINISFSFAPIVDSLGFQSGSNLYRLVSIFDIFLIWEIIIIANGFSIILGYPLKRCYLFSMLSVGLIPGLHTLLIVFDL